MTSQTMQKAISVLLLVAFPATMMAAEMRGAMLYASDGVQLNGAASPSSSAVFAGDTVLTLQRASANLMMKGSSVTLQPASRIDLQRGAIELVGGTVSVLTDGSLKVTARNLTVSAPQGNARFEVTHLPKVVLITANTGSLVVSDGEIERTVDQGFALRIDNPDAQGGNDRQRGGAVPAAGGPGLGHLSLRTASIVAALAVGGAIAAVLLLTRDKCEEDISPSVPCP